MHYYKFNITDWAHATSHLSLVDEAIYFRLINYYYDTEKPIPLELKMVLRKLRMSEYEDEVLVILDEFFEKTDKGYKNSKCETLIREYKKNIVKNRENGAKGGRPRKDAASKETKGKPTGLFSETQLEPSDNPNITLTNNYKPSTIKHEPLDITPTAKPSAKSSMVTFTQWIDGLNESGEDAIPADHPIFEKAQAIGISRDYLALAWYAFRRNYTNEASKSYKRKYAGSTGWRRVFVTAVMEDWLKLWQINGQTNEYYLTTKGKQLMQEMNNENV